ncbi:MAG TPA: rubrerythrin family protein [Patescibacteria group bacterium]|nr:rubrerythrin family protein [Patescibacteria group bacterium]
MHSESGLWAGLVVAGIAAGMAIGQTQMKMQLHQKTMENLDTAMKGEAFAYAKYSLFAEQARKNGHPEIADLFENAAKTERFEHFAEEAELAGLAGTDEENLRHAIQGESYEAQTMYKQFADEAALVGDHQAAARFEEIRQDEMKHRDRFQAALNKLTEASRSKQR